MKVYIVYDCKTGKIDKVFLSQKKALDYCQTAMDEPDLRISDMWAEK